MCIRDRPFIAHASAVIDDQPHAYRDIFAFEHGELLFDFIFQDAKTLLFEAVRKAAAIVQHGRVQNDEVHLDFYG